MNILLALHNDLRCPVKQHQLFWKAHCLKACPGNLVSILSRIALLSKSRNILLTILRSVLNRAVNQDKWLWDYAHSLHHGHRILINPCGFGNVQSPSNTQQGSGNGEDTSQGSNQVQSQGRSFLSQYKADTSKDSYLGQTPKQIRESARKTLNFAKTATPSFASPLQYFTQGKALTNSSSSGNEDPSVPPQPIPVARDTRLSVIRTNTIVKPSQMASKMTPPNSQPHSAKVNRPDSGILNKAIPLKPSLALQQITEDEEDEGEEDENEEEDTEHDEDHSRLTSENAMRDSVMLKIKTNKARRIEESEEEDGDKDEDDEEEQELIKKRKEQFRIIQRLSGLAPTPANITTNTRVASSAGLDETKTIHTAQEPIVINKDDTNALFLSCTAEIIQDLVDLWKSSLPWKVRMLITSTLIFIFFYCNALLVAEG